MKIEPLPAWSLLTRSGVAGLLARPDGGLHPAIRLGTNLDAISAAEMPLLATLRLIVASAQPTGSPRSQPQTNNPSSSHGMGLRLRRMKMPR